MTTNHIYSQIFLEFDKQVREKLHGRELVPITDEGLKEFELDTFSVCFQIDRRAIQAIYDNSMDLIRHYYIEPGLKGLFDYLDSFSGPIYYREKRGFSDYSLENNMAIDAVTMNINYHILKHILKDGEKN